MDFVTSHFGMMNLWPTFVTYSSSKLDSPSPMFWLEDNLVLSHVLITGESDFDEKMSKKCSTCVQLNRVVYHIGITRYKIGTLGD